MYRYCHAKEDGSILRWALECERLKEGGKGGHGKGRETMFEVKIAHKSRWWPELPQTMWQSQRNSSDTQRALEMNLFTFGC